MSILHHITNQHSWLSDAGYNHCAHEPLTEQEQRHKAWLQPGSFAHRALQSVVLDKRLLQDMGMVSVCAVACGCYWCNFLRHSKL